MTPGQIVGVAFGAIFGLVLLIMATVVVFAIYMVRLFSTEIFRLHGLSYGLDFPTKGRPPQKDGESEIGLEASAPLSNVSNSAVKSVPLEDAVENDLGITPTWAFPDSSSDSASGRLFSSILFNNRHNATSKGSPAPSSSGYDSFSRTVWVQKLLEKSSPGETVIHKVRDPYSNNVISVGGIVVVVKPFHGKNTLEFASLHTGDLIRVFKFYVKEESPAIGKSLHIHPANPTEQEQEEQETSDPALEFLDSDSAVYPNLYCTGLVLSTYLEYNVASGNMSLRMRESSSEGELVGDFPLSAISLETTVLKSVCPKEGSPGFGDFA